MIRLVKYHFVLCYKIEVRSSTFATLSCYPNPGALLKCCTKLGDIFLMFYGNLVRKQRLFIAFLQFAAAYSTQDSILFFWIWLYPTLWLIMLHPFVSECLLMPHFPFFSLVAYIYHCTMLLLNRQSHSFSSGSVEYN